jgi:antitoxin (DNA-binding transcriptional repressor) of toxin-antitoxin stability system
MRRVTAITVSTFPRSQDQILRQVQRGGVFVVVQGGRPVARMEPTESNVGRCQAAARTKLFERLAAQRAMNIGSWRRPSLYDR